MKASFTRGLRSLMVFLIIVLAVAADVARAQLPDCTSGNIMYVIFNRDTTSNIADSSEIRSVDVNTGAIGGLVGGRRYWIRKVDPGNASLFYYGSSGLGVDMITNRFYVMTQMSPAMGKDIITINPVTGVSTIIGTTPASVNNHHFVKLAISPNGFGYAIGVARSAGQSAATYNPVIRFSTCGAAPTTNCATITLLGYITAGPNMYKGKLFNGDIAFDTYGNLFFATAAFDSVGSVIKYTNARLFRIDAADLPSSAGTGIIPMTFVSDYDNLDSTVVCGIGLDATGQMALATRRFFNPSTNPNKPYYSELYLSPTPGVANLVAGFAPIPANNVIADIASCYFPSTILGGHKLQLFYKYENSNVNLRWQITNNNETAHFEVQRSNDGTNFETITIIPVVNPEESSAAYTFSDPQNGFDKNKFYRVRQVMKASARHYSNVVSINFNHKISLTANLKPNPFNNQLEANLWLRAANNIDIRMLDQSGRTVYRRQVTGKTGDNKVMIGPLGKLKPGIYIVEMAVQDHVIREKVIKQ